MSVVCSAPLGATVLGSEMPGPPGCDNGAVGSVKRCCSRPGCTLEGIGCADAWRGPPMVVTAIIAAKVAMTHTRGAIRRMPPAAIFPEPQVTDLVKFLWHGPGRCNCFHALQELAHGISGGCLSGATGGVQGGDAVPHW